MVDIKQKEKKWSLMGILAFIALWALIYFTFNAFASGGSATKYEENNYKPLKEKQISLEKGNHTIEFTIQNDNITNTHESIWNFHIAGLNNFQQSYSKEIYANDFWLKKFKTFQIPIFSVKNGTKFKLFLHTWYNNSLHFVWVKSKKDEILINKRKSIKELYYYEENEFTLDKASIIDDKLATNWKTIKISSKTERFSVFGPYSKKEKEWVHRAYFRMKTIDNSSHKDLVQIQVYNPWGDGVNKSLNIKASDFKKNNTYQNFYIDYERTTSGSIEFRTLYLWDSTLYLDNVINEGAYK